MLLSHKKYPKAGVYSEVELLNKDIVDVLIDLGKDKIFYEVQKEISPDWIEKIKNRDLDLDTNTQIIPLKELSDDLNVLVKQLKERLI
jgi:hypothetical protein